MEKSGRKPSLLIVDDNDAMLSTWRRTLRSDFNILTASSSTEALERINANPDIAMLDIRLDDDDPGNREGITLLKKFLDISPELPVVMISAYGDVNLAVECINLGAADFVDKNDRSVVIKERLLKAYKQGRFYRRAKFLEAEFEKKAPVKLVGQSAEIRELKQMIHYIARDSEISVLIRGETGTGKELVAKSIYRMGRRAHGPFVDVSISAIPETLIASELFGHERGAFTDAKELKKGRFELAHGGVLFLDEIGDLSLAAQVQLLRVLEERRFHRLGGSIPIRVDVQLLAATNRNLEEMIQKGEFRQDLYFRLKGLEIHVPPLRERKEDIPLLVEHFIINLQELGRTRIRGIEKEAMASLFQYSWPGNVRELNRAIESATFYAEIRKHASIQVEDLPAEITTTSEMISRPVVKEGFDLFEHRARAELACIDRALEQTRGKKSEASKILGLKDRFVLHRRVTTILSKYPHLIHDFYHVKQGYHNSKR